MIVQMDVVVGDVYQQFRKKSESVWNRETRYSTEAGSISEEDEQWLKEHIDEFFNKGKGA